MSTTASDARALTALLSYSAWNVTVGREVVDALAGMGRDAVEALAGLLADDGAAPVARMTAARLLARAGGEDAARALCGARGATDPEVADQALRGLEALGAAPCLAAA